MTDLNSFDETTFMVDQDALARRQVKSIDARSSFMVGKAVEVQTAATFSRGTVLVADAYGVLLNPNDNPDDTREYFPWSAVTKVQVFQ